MNNINYNFSMLLKVSHHGCSCTMGNIALVTFVDLVRKRKEGRGLGISQISQIRPWCPWRSFPAAQPVFSPVCLLQEKAAAGQPVQSPSCLLPLPPVSFSCLLLLPRAPCLLPPPGHIRGWGGKGHLLAGCQVLVCVVSRLLSLVV